MDCLTDIVGVTGNTSIPFYADLSEEMQDAIAVSGSGLYMDALPGGIDLMTVDTQESMEFALQSALDAKEEAEKSLKSDLIVAINNRYQPAKIKFYGLIGERSVSGVLSTTGRYQAHRYRMIEPIAGNVQINQISLCLNGVATFNVYVGRCNVKSKAIEEIVATVPITTVSGTWTNATLPEGGIAVPMEIYGTEQEIYVFYDRTEAGGLLPKNNTIKCLCPGDNGKKALNAYMQYNGCVFNDKENLSSAKADQQGHGISVQAVVGCDTNTIVCREYEKQDNIQLMMAWGLRYKAGVLWIEYIFKGGQVNRVNLQNHEYLWGKRNHFQKQYEDRITAIANNLTLGETNCFTCKDDKVIKGTIYS